MKIYLTILIVMIALSGCAKVKPVRVIDGSESVFPSFIHKNAKIEVIFASSRLFEAPVWDRINNTLYFTGYEKGKEMLMQYNSLGKADVVPLTQGTGGTFIGVDPQFLFTANGETHEIIRFQLNGNQWQNPKVLAGDKTWFQPNDICLTKDSKIYFTDPDFKNKKGGAVYYLSSMGVVSQVIFDLPVPNGIIASNDGKKLYVSDSHLKEWREFKISKDGTLDKGKVFFKPRTSSKNNPDGMTIDKKGNLYLTGLGGVWIVSPKGNAIGFIAIPEFCTNIAFGGEDYKTLFISCYKKVYQLSTNMTGYIPPPKK